jgi:hypothetical protein
MEIQSAKRTLVGWMVGATDWIDEESITKNFRQSHSLL